MYICDVAGCYVKCNNRSRLLQHKENDHAEKVFVCFFCSYDTKDSSRFKHHTLSHPGIQPRSCSKCSTTFWDLEELREHQEEHPEVKRSCNQCQYQTPFLSSFANHLWTCHKVTLTHFIKSNNSTKPEPERSINSETPDCKLIINANDEDTHTTGKYEIPGKSTQDIPTPAKKNSSTENLHLISTESTHRSFSTAEPVLIEEEIKEKLAIPRATILLPNKPAKQKAQPTKRSAQKAKQDIPVSRAVMKKLARNIEEKYRREKDKHANPKLMDTVEYNCEICGLLAKDAFKLFAHMTRHLGGNQQL